MKIISSNSLDKARWDALLTKFHADIFSYSWYLDSCAANWCVLVDDDFENGIALSYTVKMGIEMLTPPIFVRSLDFIGSDKHFPEKALQIIQERFSIGQMQTATEISTNDAVNTERIYQAISDEVNLNQQAKRMCQKAQKNNVEVRPTEQWQTIFEIIQSELVLKISEFTPDNLQRLHKLITSLAQEQKLICYGIFQQNELKGGMLFMESDEKRIYLKGACTAEAKNLGGMYLCMLESIQETKDEKRIFDFGGSGVEGVRRFNLNLGGTDQTYYIYQWNRAPWWFNFIKSMYQKWKKK